MDVVKQEFTLGWAQLLAVFYRALPRRDYTAGQNNGGSYYGASQSTSTNLINASDILVTLCFKYSFFSKRRYLEIIYISYPLYPLPLIRGRGVGLYKKGFTSL